MSSARARRHDPRGDLPIETLQKGMTQGERHSQLLASLGHAYALSGERNKALKTLDELRDISKAALRQSVLDCHCLCRSGR